MEEKPLIIDPPVGPYSPIGEIKTWLKELEAMNQSDERDFSIQQVKEWIAAHAGE